ncbi:hypothetical protein [Nocardia fluminea]|uniref:hypothetical protein n=1 Tax=Nocardia fluminea TaxID=134984 RepID=UPI003F4DC048
MTIPAGPVGAGQLVVTSRDITPMLRLVERPLDHIAPLVSVGVEPGRVSTGTATAFPVGDLIRPLRDHRDDPPAATTFGSPQSNTLYLPRLDQDCGVADH